MTGKTIAHYRVGEKIGAGGMGEVYRATDTKLNRDVALKVLPEEFAKDAERMARFKREAQVLASLNHPNIAAIYGLEEDGGKQALALELVEGPTLAERIKQGAIPLDEALGIAKQIAEALEAAHDLGIIHRDLKPANVKVRDDGQVKVLDFGLAKALEGEDSAEDIANSPTLSVAATRAGVILGTAAYMSPEQARGSKVDKRTDIWAFGVVLFEMLSGGKLFTGGTISDVLASVLTREPDWEKLPETLPASMRRLLRRCLTKNRKQRLQAIGEARIALAEQEAGPEASVLMSAPALALPPPWKRVFPWAVVGVLAFVAAIALWGWLSPAPSEQKVLTRFRLDFPMVESFDGVCCGRHLAISPGGDRLAFGARDRDGGTIRLYLRNMDLLEPPVAIAGTENPAAPFFSPDGRWLAFFSDNKLKKVSIEGGSPQTLCKVGADPRGGAWGPDDTIVFASLGSSGLFRVPAAGGTPEPLTELDPARGEIAHRWPEILPGGKTVLFTVMHGGQFDVEAVSLEDGERRLLIEGATQPEYAASGHLVYARMPSAKSNEQRGTLQAVSFDPVRAEVTGPPVPILENVIVWPGGGSNYVLARNGTLAYLEGASGSGNPGTLVWVGRDGAEEPLPEPAGSYYLPRISPDGSRIALNITEGGSDRDIWVYDFSRRTFGRLTFDPVPEAGPVWSPDGSRIAFSLHGSRKIMSIPADGSSPAEEIGSSEFDVTPSSWSPDGTTLFVMEENPTSLNNIKTLDLEDEGKLEMFITTEHDEQNAAISPDGRWVAYDSKESGLREVYVRPFPGPGGKWLISREGGTEPAWSPDGKELFYRSGNRMMAVNVEGGEAFRASRPRVLFEGNYEFSLVDTGRNYDISTDGKRFLMIKPANEQQTAAPTINLVLNWFEELRRRVPVGN